MRIPNASLAAVFEQMADLLEIEGANAFRVRAYRRAANVVMNWPESLATLLEHQEELPKMPGLGADLQGKIVEMVRTGRLSVLDELQRRAPPEITSLLKIPAIGPKRVRILRDTLGIKNLSDLERAAKKGQLQKLRGFSKKMEDKVLDEIARFRGGEHRTKRVLAEQFAEPLVVYLQAIPSVRQCTIAGSYRRQRETVGDIDILVTCSEPERVMERFVNYEETARVLSHGTTRSAIELKSGLQVDLRVVPEESYGSALHYFTGSKSHNIAVRTLGVKRGLKINEYGIFRGKRRLGGKTEQEVFAAVGLPFIEPELREARGEIEAAEKSQLPKLITIQDIRGDLHAHTDDTDGRLGLEEMARAAEELGYEYLAITDHSRHLTVASGLTPARLRQQIRKIDRLNGKLKKLRILKSIECDILENGDLDLPNEVLRELDLRICSVHFKFNLSRQAQTERVLRGMDNPFFNILGHPTGRLIDEREAYEIDLEAVVAAAADRGCALELNSQPDRLDLDDVHCQLAKNHGVKVAISTDAHSDTELGFMKLGIAQARRGWLACDDAINTWPLPKLLKWTRRK